MVDFHAVYERNIGRVYRVCYLRLGHREDAEDAAQNVFIRWLRAGGKAFASEEHEKAYFLKAACNECVNMKRSLWRKNRVDFDDLPESVTAVEDAEPEDGALLRGLPRKYREVLYLYYYEELSAAEVAETLGRNESTVRTQLQKGRERLKKMLAEGDDRA